MGPLTGVRIIEIVGIGPGPFAGMMLADQGAEVIAVERASGDPGAPVWNDPTRRNRRSIALDLQKPEAVEALLRLVEGADALFEGFRPGVAERLGFGPDVCRARNKKLVYGRMTGWGQDGPLARTAGHDLNYISIAGALHSIGRAGGRPVPPLNLVGDYGGGGMLLAFGLVCALLHARKTGKGQVVDAAMVDGTAALMAPFIGFRDVGFFEDGVGVHMLSGAAHFYDTYECADGKFVSVACIEPKFYAEFLKLMEIDDPEFSSGVFTGLESQAKLKPLWGRLKARLAEQFRKRPRDDWAARFEGTDACVTPVLTLSEAPEHPHNKARGVFTEVGGGVQNAPAPRYSETPNAPPRAADTAGGETCAVLSECGFSADEIEALKAAGALS